MVTGESANTPLRAFIIVALALASAPAAAAPLIGGLGGPNGYGTDHLPPNDDGSSAAIPITSAFPGGLTFFGGPYTEMWVNTNGNITFSGSLGTYTPSAFPVASRPMIAPYWADVDIRGAAYPANNEVTWVLRPGQMFITWHNVGYYSNHDNLKMDFQLIISDSMSCGAGDFEVEFRFNTCGWETGDASGGSGGFGGTPAQSGFDAGNMTDYVEIMGSRMPGIASRLCTESNVAMPGIWQFSVRSGAVMCPGSGEPCDTGLLGVCAAGLTQCVGDSITCVGRDTGGVEVCDGLDNDCDGDIDEGGDLCASPTVCALGACVAPCFEGGCAPEDTCNEMGFCIETACIDVECGPGERCVGGECLDACGGVVCPRGQLCLGGSCTAACDLITCGEGSICDDGDCICPCPGRRCADDETCGADGRCISPGCDLTSCDLGFYCEDGACLDSCAGAVCPTGQVCRMGSCIPEARMEPDAGTGGSDAGPLPDTGIGERDDASTTADAEVDGGRVARGTDPGCACRVGSSGSPAHPWMALGVLGLVLARRRRRNRA